MLWSSDEKPGPREPIDATTCDESDIFPIWDGWDHATRDGNRLEQDDVNEVTKVHWARCFRLLHPVYFFLSTTHWFGRVCSFLAVLYRFGRMISDHFILHVSVFGPEGHAVEGNFPLCAL